MGEAHPELAPPLKHWEALHQNKDVQNPLAGLMKIPIVCIEVVVWIITLPCIKQISSTRSQSIIIIGNFFNIWGSIIGHLSDSKHT